MQKALGRPMRAYPLFRPPDLQQKRTRLLTGSPRASKLYFNYNTSNYKTGF